MANHRFHGVTRQIHNLLREERFSYIFGFVITTMIISLSTSAFNSFMSYDSTGSVSPVTVNSFESGLESTVLSHLDDNNEPAAFHKTTISDMLKVKGEGAVGTWLWCKTDDTVDYAFEFMTQNNVEALLVAKPGAEQIPKSIAGIFSHQDYFWEDMAQGRSSNSTNVGDVMTEANKLITITPDTKNFEAMQLMTANYIRRIHVVDDEGMIRMVTILDVGRAVLTEFRDELDRINGINLTRQ